LDGSLPGDFGFDPLKLGSDPDLLKWFTQAELVHCRWAMLGMAGILFPEVASKVGALDVPDWWVAGKVAQDSSDIPFGTLVGAEIIFFGWVEGKRWADFKNPGSQADGSFVGVTEPFAGSGNGYPGGPWFDPFGFGKGDAAKLEEYKWAEIRNGRLAMVAFVGFVSQHYATGKDPVQNLIDHVSDPTHVTFATNGVSLPHAVNL